MRPVGLINININKDTAIHESGLLNGTKNNKKELLESYKIISQSHLQQVLKNVNQGEQMCTEVSASAS